VVGAHPRAVVGAIERYEYADLLEPEARGLLGDSLAGVTVALVALPLSIAIAIASGATPRAGLVTAIIGGFLISLLGGSRVQIGGPTGAFIVVVAGVIAQYGFDGL
jgi:SulP family sulfate permease